MDPWLVLTAWAWIVPVTGGVIAVGVVGMRRRGRVTSRRLGYDAARLELREARQVARQRGMAARVARADMSRIAAERRAQRATPQQVAEAKQIARQRDRDAKAAEARVRVSRVRVSAARAEMGARVDPLQRLYAAHDAVTARWLEYETDPARAIAYPAMSDSRSAESAAHFRAAAQANELRREVEGRSPTPEQFSAYRDAVAELERAFAAAEAAAKAQAGERPSGTGWQDAAKSAIAQAADEVANTIERWTRRRRDE